jgi:hypothetical protein
VSEGAWFKSILPIYVPLQPREEKFIITGWPVGGGVWVLSSTASEASAKNAGMAFNASTMEERCKIIEKLGGRFYANPKDCPDLDLA